MPMFLYFFSKKSKIVNLNSLIFFLKKCQNDKHSHFCQKYPSFMAFPSHFFTKKPYPVPILFFCQKCPKSEYLYCDFGTEFQIFLSKISCLGMPLNLHISRVLSPLRSKILTRAGVYLGPTNKIFGLKK